MEEIETVRDSLMREAKRIIEHYLLTENSNFMAHSDDLQTIMHALEKFR